MITIVNFEELKRLIKYETLTTSGNYDYLNKQTQGIVEESFASKGKIVAKILYLKALDGDLVTTEHKELALGEESPLLTYLPQFEDDNIVLVVDELEETLTITDEILEELNDSGLVDINERQFFLKVLEEGADIKFDNVVYGISTELHLADVKAILYPEYLEDKVTKLRQDKSLATSLFVRSNLFT